MNSRIDCEVFQDQLDSLGEGELGAEGLAGLRIHAESCPDCGKLLELHEHLASARQDELEAAVPETWVASMHERVRSRIEARSRGFGEGRGKRSGRRWLVPSLAAASVLMALAAGALTWQLGRVRERERALARAVADHERRLAELDRRVSRSGAGRSAGLLGGAWSRAIGDREQVTLGELVRTLERVPATVTVLSGPAAERLLGQVAPWREAAWRRAASGIDAKDGVQAGELLRVLEAMELEPDFSISARRILSGMTSGSGS